MAKRKQKPDKPLLKLDFGCGPNKKDGFKGVDVRPFKGVDHVTDLTKPWPWGDDTVEEGHASHFIEHLDADERIHFFNELHRVLIPGGKCIIITTNWASNRAYGDLSHKWPPVSEMFYYYLLKDWRAVNAPHNDFYTCDFDAVWGYSMHNELLVKNQEYQQHAQTFYKEAAQDIICTVTKRAK